MLVHARAHLWLALAGLLSLNGMLACTGEIAGKPTGAPGAAGVSAAGAGGGPAVPPVSQCAAAAPRTPLRRLTIFEYNNTVRDLLGDATSPGSGFPAEELSNGFGNDAYAQGTPPGQVQAYQAAAESLAKAATAPDKLAGFAPCAAQLTASSDAAAEAGCVRSVVDSFGPRAFRRALRAGETDGLVALFKTIRALSGETFVSSLTAIVAAILQEPHFLYRPELGVAVSGRTDVLKPSGEEMASRLSYYLWASTPDSALMAAAASGELLTSEGVKAQAQRLLNDPKARGMVRYFFDNLLPVAGLAHLERDPGQYPAYSAEIGALMREETESFVDHQIFAGPGTWPSILSSNTTFLNEKLAAFYGIGGVTGPEFREVAVDGVKRGGLFTQAGVVAGPIHSNHTNPVTRGAFVLRKMLCTPISVPTDPAIAALVKEPAPYSAPTARERFNLHRQQPICASCHQLMDPIGFALENYDAVGQWRDQENGVTIDASGSTPVLATPFIGGVELGKSLAASETAQACFASQWLNFAYGRLAGEREACTSDQVKAAFKAAGYNVKALLVALTQTNEFLQLAAARE
jgi:Protein of unknown function (DUF1592)/Protein of unknown function (DUF1588)/Protein of unknown function (DUF1587)/Protein of unknown function (DUF1595)/Protein of unknown function (DUF1585)